MNKYKKYIFKKNPILVFDFLKAKKMPNKSLNAFKKEKNEQICTNFNVNYLANQLHPHRQNVIVKEIINHKNDCYTYVFEGDNHQLAFFRSGQYVTLNVNIDGCEISRPYSICSSPLEAIENNIYKITIKYLKNGFFSKYVIKNLKIGDKCWLSGPEGEFYYDNLRDKKKIVLIAGGIGITPFISLIRDIIENNLNIHITLLYSCKKKKDFCFYDELNEYNKNKNINVVFFTTREKNKNCINSRIDLKTFKTYSANSSIFICGSKSLCDTIISFAKEQEIENKLIRYENNEVIKLSTEKEYKNIGKKQFYKIKVNYLNNTYEIKANRNDSILVSLQKAKLHTQSKCLSGRCSWCRIRLIKGSVFVPKSLDHRRKADATHNIYNSCTTYPITDIEIENY